VWFGEERLGLGDESRCTDAAVERKCSLQLRFAFLQVPLGQQLLPGSQTDVGLVANSADLRESARRVEEIAFEQGSAGAP